MTVRTDPPRVPPLSPQQHSRLRRQVMAKARPARRTAAGRWVPAIAVAAVAAVTAGAVAIGGMTGPAAPPAGSSPTRSIQPPTPLPLRDFVVPTEVDLGPYPTAASIASTACLIEKGTTEVVWARYVLDSTAGSRTSILLVRRPADGEPNDGYHQRMAVCVPYSLNNPIPDSDWDRRPTAAQGLAILTTGAFETPVTGATQFWRIYRAVPEIARVESRYVWQGGAGPWTKGVVADGFAYTDTRAKYGGKSPAGLKAQIRAFDAAGNAVPVNPS
ncbi:hypothetical protein ACFCV3_11195 [Kribbella sp. NPDC056345]|uniref:hypothetical protein n=1 Tax=Kribbella sp. NPDC056345 TaxID=3345789 RepID=UPI0035E0C276